MRPNGRVVALVLLLSVAAAGVYTYPLLDRASQAIPYGIGVPAERSGHAIVPGDHLQYYYFLAVGRDMMTGKVPLLRDPYQFHTPDASRRGGYFFFPFSALFAAVSVAGGALAYNVLVWASFPATALAVFLAGRRVGLDAAGAGLAAAIVTLLPYRVANVAGGHPSGFVLFLLPLALYFLERAWQERSAASAAGAGVSMAILGVNEPHFVFFLGFLLPLWGLSVLWRLGPSHRPREIAPSLGWLGLAAVGPTVAYAVRLDLRGGEGLSPGACAALWVCFVAILAVVWRVTGEIRSRAGFPAWGDEARSFLPLVALAAYGLRPWMPIPNLGRAILAVVAALLLATKWRLARDLARVAGASVAEASRRLVCLWPAVLGALVAVGLVLEYKVAFLDQSAAATGRDFREVRLFSATPSDFLDRTNPKLTRNLYPGAVASALALVGLAVRPARAFAGFAVGFGLLALGAGAPDWLPLYPLAFETVPFLDRIRQAAKFFVVAAIAWAFVAGFAATWLRERLGPRLGAFAVAVALVATAIDFSAVLPLGLSRLPTQNRAYAEVARRGAGSNLLELPIWPGDSHYSSIYQYWATRTRIPMVNGYSPTASVAYRETVAQPLESMNVGEMTAGQYARLRELRVRFVTIHGDAFPTKVSAYPYRFTFEAMRANPNLELVAGEDDVYLFELRDDGYRPWDANLPWPDAVFLEAEHLRRGSGRRVHDGSASGETVVRGPGPQPEVPIVFGPYLPFPAGTYTATFRVRGRGELEVAADRGEAILVRSAVGDEAFREVSLPFTLDRTRKLEFRARSTAALEIDWVAVTKIDAPPGSEPGRIEAENLRARSGGVGDVPDASNGAVARIVPEHAARGTVVLEGPYRVLASGSVRVGVRSRGGALGVSLESADGREVFGILDVPSSETWKTVDGTFDVPGSGVVRTAVRSRGEAAEVDFVELGPAS